MSSSCSSVVTAGLSTSTSLPCRMAAIEMPARSAGIAEPPMTAMVSSSRIACIEENAGVVTPVVVIETDDCELDGLGWHERSLAVSERQALSRDSIRGTTASLIVALPCLSKSSQVREFFRRRLPLRGHNVGPNLRRGSCTRNNRGDARKGDKTAQRQLQQPDLTLSGKVAQIVNPVVHRITNCCLLNRESGPGRMRLATPIFPREETRR